MGNSLDVLDSPTAAGSQGPSAEAVFDPARYFDRWMNEVEVVRRRLGLNHSDEADTSEFFFKLQPGSKGDLIFEGVLHFDGHSMGNIVSPGGTLVVTQCGVVDADIDVGTALIYGSVTGNITANERVFLADEARVTGQITTRLLSVKPGAVFVGDCIFTSFSDESEEGLQTFGATEESDELDHALVGV